MNALVCQFGGMPDAGVLADTMRLAEVLAKSSMIPECYRGKPSDVLVCLLWGQEVRLGPLQALQGIAVINGRPAIWGDTALALVRTHPAFVSCREGVEGEGDDRHGWCEVVRRGQPPERRTFSVADAKRAKLWLKAGPWTAYPDRMLQMRARGFAIRDTFADALRGVVTVEEAQDYPAEVRDVPNLAVGPTALPPASSFRLDALDTALSNINTAEVLRAYLEQPAQCQWLDRLRRTNPEQAAQAETMIAATWARVDPASREGEEAPLPWRSMSWPIFSRDGTCQDLGDADSWEAAFASRIATIEGHQTVPAEAKPGKIRAVLSANREVLDWLRERGHGEAVDAVEGLFAEALGVGQEVAA